jgi:hypothetical protein
MFILFRIIIYLFINDVEKEMSVLQLFPFLII